MRTLVSQLQLSNGSALFVTTQALLANSAKTTKGADDDDWHCTLLCLGTIGAAHANHAEVSRYWHTVTTDTDINTITNTNTTTNTTASTTTTTNIKITTNTNVTSSNTSAATTSDTTNTMPLPQQLPPTTTSPLPSPTSPLWQTLPPPPTTTSVTGDTSLSEWVLQVLVDHLLGLPAPDKRFLRQEPTIDANRQYWARLLFVLHAGSSEQCSWCRLLNGLMLQLRRLPQLLRHYLRTASNTTGTWH